MPRPPRIHIVGGCYHVILRGNHREAIFATSADRSALNEIVADALDRSQARLHAFCWMTNHLHALIQVGERPLGVLMKRIAMRYSRYRHRQLRTRGHLFERRYKSLLIDVDNYFVALLRYIHLNPVKAAIVTNPADYRWSSHRAYLGDETIPWVQTEFGLGLFGETLAEARQAYRFMLSQELLASEESFFEVANAEDSRILGSDRFMESLNLPSYKPRSSLTLAELAQTVSAQHALSLESVRSASRQRHLTAARIDIALRALDGRIASLKQVAEFLGRDPASLSELLTRHRLR